MFALPRSYRVFTHNMWCSLLQLESIFEMGGITIFIKLYLISVPLISWDLYGKEIQSPLLQIISSASLYLYEVLECWVLTVGFIHKIKLFLSNNSFNCGSLQKYEKFVVNFCGVHSRKYNMVCRLKSTCCNLVL